jgi:hypothetical protein
MARQDPRGKPVKATVVSGSPGSDGIVVLDFGQIVNVSILGNDTGTNVWYWIQDTASDTVKAHQTTSSTGDHIGTAVATGSERNIQIGARYISVHLGTGGTGYTYGTHWTLVGWPETGN